MRGQFSIPEQAQEFESSSTQPVPADQVLPDRDRVAAQGERRHNLLASVDTSPVVAGFEEPGSVDTSGVVAGFQMSISGRF